MADEIGMTTLAFGFIAIASSVFMSISPVPFFWRILKNKTTQEFHPYPFAASCISHYIWGVYCLWELNDRFFIRCLIICCWVGFTFDLLFIVVYLGCCTNERISVIMVCIILTGMLSVFVFPIGLISNVDDPAKKVLLGTLGVLSGIIMHLSPLSNIIHVYRTKSSKYMPFVRCITIFPSCICWLIFACMKESFDWYLVIANGLGSLLGLVPLSILYKFYENPSKSCAAKCLESTLDVDPREDIVVLNRICPRCKGIMFEQKEMIRFHPDTKYMLYQIDGSKRWRVNAAATKTVDILTSYAGVSVRFDKLLRDTGKPGTEQV